MTIETRHLKVFVAVYNTRSFTKAAEELYTSQPTVSEHIQNLESRLNCKLFDRLGRTILPTNEAELLYTRAITILEDLQKLEDDITASTQTISGKLTIGASTIPGTYILPGVASTFKANYPKTSFEILINDSAKIIEDIDSNRLFLGAVGAKIGSSRVEYIPFAIDQLILVAAGGYKTPATIDPNELPKHPFLIREKGSGTRKTIENLLKQKDLSIRQLNISATLGSSAAVKEAVKSNLGISILSKKAVQEELANKNLKEIKLRGLDMQREFYLVRSAKRTLPNRYQAFLDTLIGQ